MNDLSCNVNLAMISLQGHNYYPITYSRNYVFRVFSCQANIINSASIKADFYELVRNEMYYRDLNLFLRRLKYIYVNTDKSVNDSEISGV